MKKTKSKCAKSSDFKSKMLKSKGAKNKDVKKGHEEQGFVLIVGMIVMVVLLLLAVPFLYQLSFEKRLTDKSYKSSAAFFLAEAGVDRAIWELNYGDISTWDGDSSLRTMAISSFQTPNGNVIGDIDIRIEEPNADNPVVESTGRVASVGSLQVISKTTRIVLKRGGSPPIFDYGAFGDVSVEIESNAIFDSYDSRVGLYGGSNIGCQADVGTNATTLGCIDLYSNAEIHGNAFSGPESDPDQVIITRANSQIYGEKLALSRPKEMPSITIPEGLLYRGDYFLGGTDCDAINQSGEYTSFRLDSGAKVTITADVTLYISGEFSMLSNTQLEIAEGASLAIYLGGSFVQGSNSQINNLSQDPTQLLLLGTDSFNSIMEWNSNSQFWGAVYVPRAEVNFNSNADFFGSLIANRIDSISSNTKIHYDGALADLSVEAAGENAPLEVKSWQVKQ
jgi:Tfp pilus assembly protein PilX